MNFAINKSNAYVLNYLNLLPHDKKSAKLIEKYFADEK